MNDDNWRERGMLLTTLVYSFDFLDKINEKDRPEYFREMEIWCYENFEGRFAFLNTDTIYCNSETDLMAFILRWN